VIRMCSCENSLVLAGAMLGPLSSQISDSANMNGTRAAALRELHPSGSPHSERLPLAWHALSISVSMPNGALSNYSEVPVVWCDPLWR
jgi:hypothetical protein